MFCWHVIISKDLGARTKGARPYAEEDIFLSGMLMRWWVGVVCFGFRSIGFRCRWGFSPYKGGRPLLLSRSRIAKEVKYFCRREKRMVRCFMKHHSSVSYARRFWGCGKGSPSLCARWLFAVCNGCTLLLGRLHCVTWWFGACLRLSLTLR